MYFRVFWSNSESTPSCCYLWGMGLGFLLPSQGNPLPFCCSNSELSKQGQTLKQGLTLGIGRPAV